MLTNSGNKNSKNKKQKQINKNTVKLQKLKRKNNVVDSSKTK